uniref:Tripartite motif containing 35-14 n=1 Tax=Amphiprion percula TaxID=161767 RepID=A0A3P8U1F0_AMPPE
MAVRSLTEVELTCPICCDIFREPVVLKCSHSFCASCLQQYWGPHGRNRDCPLCRTQSLDDPVPSLTLRNLCESYLNEGEGPEEAAAAAAAVGEMYCDPGEMCPVHGEKLKLYCLLEQEPICVVCHTSRKHKQHDCCPVSEAVVDVKVNSGRNNDVFLLWEKMKDAFDKMKKNYEDTVVHIQAQARFVERRTREEFEKLHSFLQAEEEAKMDALRREEEQKSGEMKQKIEEMERNISSVSASIRVLEEEVSSEGISVLHSAMFSSAPVTLDPNTAAPWLVLSDDLTSVCDSEEKQKLPDNPERFDPDTAVLGWEGFTSGKQAWDVNVGDNTAWVVGVAKESVQRKKKVSSVLSNGYLCVYFYHNMYFAGTSPLTRLTLKKSPQRVRVLLDCDKGRVSFYDPQNDVNIYTFKHAITEKVFPYFWVGCQKCPLTVEPVDVGLRAVTEAQN